MYRVIQLHQRVHRTFKLRLKLLKTGQYRLSASLVGGLRQRRDLCDDRFHVINNHSWNVAKYDDEGQCDNRLYHQVRINQSLYTCSGVGHEALWPKCIAVDFPGARGKEQDIITHQYPSYEGGEKSKARSINTE